MAEVSDPALFALNPLDGRYGERIKELAVIFSESGLIRARLAVEVEWLIRLCNVLKLEGTSILSEVQVKALRKLYKEFQVEFGEEVKEIEKTTNHDVKAVEYFLQKALKALKREDLIPFLHFACTSEDINNLAYGQMFKAATHQVMLPVMKQLLEALRDVALECKDIPMMSRTHGQPATPTTIGKELKNVGARLLRQWEQLQKQEFLGKFNGATGNFNAHVVAYPEVDWLQTSKAFVESLGLTWLKYTTQIEPHDYLAELSDVIRRFNTIVLDFDRDVWMLISYGHFKQKLKEGEVGSSTMPHKVNPIDFENSEGNLGLANALFGHFSEKLPLSRMQRDLTDSTVLRNVGVAFGYSLLAYKSTLKGISKLEVNEASLAKELDENWTLLAEPIQTVLRRYGVADAYEQLKKLTRGTEVNQKTIQTFVDGLEIPEEAKNRLRELTPATYIGLAKDL
jgi:adenylosuccinate lyase